MKMSMQDPYAVLGVRRNAGPDEIKAAWRAVAKAVHPDQNREDPNATARFAEAGRAYEVLKDPQMRNRYDQARRDADLRRMEEMKRRADRSRAPEPPVGPETAEEAVSRIFGTDNGKPEATKAAAPKPAAARPAPPPPRPEAPAEAKAADEGADETATEAAASHAPFGPSILARAAAPAAEIVSSLFRRILPAAPEVGEKPADKAHEKAGDKPAAERVPDLVCEAVATVEDLFRRRRVTATLPDGQVLKVALPAGTTDGSLIRLREQGYRQGAARGDALVSIRVARDAHFRVDGTDVRTTLSLSLHDAVLGCTTTVATVTGQTSLVVPPWSGPDRPLRIPDQGLPMADGRRGALIIELSLTLGARPDQKLMDLMRSQRDGLVL
ncbi:MAG: DnaJ C-terminal domain-containing protein [Pararhizobium sp.]